MAVGGRESGGVDRRLHGAACQALEPALAHGHVTVEVKRAVDTHLTSSMVVCGVVVPPAGAKLARAAMNAILAMVLAHIWTWCWRYEQREGKGE
jgi:hypothetical protein